MTRTHVVVAAVLIAAALFRVAHTLSASGDAYAADRAGDEIHYHEWAGEISQGQFVRDAPFFTSPLYAYALALAYRIGGESLATARILNVLLGASTVCLIFLLARDVFDQRTAVLAAVLYGFSAVSLFYETFPDKTTLVTFLAAVGFLASERALRGGSPRRWFLAGLAVGVAALAHALLLVFVPVIAGVAVWRRGPDRLRCVALFATGGLLAIAPATAHNYVAGADFVLINSNGGQNFYLGNHAGNATGLYTSPPFSGANLALEEQGFQQEAERRVGRRLLASQASRFWFRQAWKEICQHRLLSLRRLWRKLRWSFGNEELTDTRTWEFYRSRMPLLRFWGFGPVALLGLCGCFSLGGRKDLAVFSLFTVVYGVVLSLFFVYGRYRFPLIVPLSVLAAGLISHLWILLRQRQIKALMWHGAGMLLLGWFVFARALPDRQVSFLPDYFNQGNRYYERGLMDQAVGEYEKAIFVRPGNHPAAPSIAVELANLELSLGRTNEAADLLRRAVARHPNHATLRERLRTIQKWQPPE